MAKVPIAFGRTDTGKTISDITWDFCKKISDSTNVETSGSILVEHGKGMYVLDNPNITEDSTFSIFLTTDLSKYVEGVFSLSDGDIARDTTLSNVSLSMQSISGDVDNIDLSLQSISNDINDMDLSLQSISGDVDNIDNDISTINITLSGMNISLTDLTDEAFGKWIIDPIAKTLTLYRASNNTAFVIFNLTEGSVNEVRPYVARTPI